MCAVTDIAQARLLAVAIKLSSVLKPYEIQSALEWWEKVTFRIFGMFRRDSRYKVGDYTRLAYKIINNQLDKINIIEEIKNIGINHPIDDAVKELAETDCYNGWEKELKYFLYRYEEYLAKLHGKNLSAEIWEKIWANSPSTTIEHIHP